MRNYFKTLSVQTNQHSHKRTIEQTFKQKLTRLQWLVSHPGLLYRCLEKDCFLLLVFLQVVEHLVLVNRWSDVLQLAFAWQHLKASELFITTLGFTIQEQNNNHSLETVSMMKVPTNVSKIPASSLFRCLHRRTCELGEGWQHAKYCCQTGCHS